MKKEEEKKKRQNTTPEMDTHTVLPAETQGYEVKLRVIFGRSQETE